MGTGKGNLYRHTFGEYNNADSEIVSNKEEAKDLYDDDISSADRNAEYVKEKYGLNENGYFAEKGKNCRVYKSDDPIRDSIDFYQKFGRGGETKNLSNGKGTITTLDDGTIIVHRIITSTEGSPAVSINIKSPCSIKTQKIHFIKE